MSKKKLKMNKEEALKFAGIWAIEIIKEAEERMNIYDGFLLGIVFCGVTEGLKTSKKRVFTEGDVIQMFDAAEKQIGKFLK